MSSYAKIARLFLLSFLIVFGFSFVLSSFAVSPSDHGLHEGDLISAIFSDDPDVYIVNEHGYKRLFLNPEIFKFYSHLGGFTNVKLVTPEIRDSFPTTGLFRNCEKNDPKVYGFESDNEDNGQLRWINTSGAQAVQDDPDFFKKVFCINDKEFKWYKRGQEFKSVKEVPQYHRATAVTPAVPAIPAIPASPSHPLVSPTTTPHPASGSFTPTPTPASIAQLATPATSATPAQPVGSSSTPTPTPTTSVTPTPSITVTPTPSLTPTASTSYSPTPTPTSASGFATVVISSQPSGATAVDADSGYVYCQSTPCTVSIAVPPTSRNFIFSKAGYLSKTSRFYFVESTTTQFISVTLSVLAAGDTTPPAITSFSVHNPLLSEAIIVWSNNEPTVGQVEWGTTSSYGNKFPTDSSIALGNFSFSTDHSIGITLNKTQNTTYHYRMISKDATGNKATSSDQTFTTMTCSPVNVSISPSTPPQQNVSPGQSGVPLAVFNLTDNCYLTLQSFAVSLLPMPNGYQNISSLRLYNNTTGLQLGSTIAISGAAPNFTGLSTSTSISPRSLSLKVVADISPSAVAGTAVYAVFGGSSEVDEGGTFVGNNASGNLVSGHALTVTAPTSTPATTSSTSFDFNRDLYLGSRGNDVQKLQALLVNEVGYSANLITGYFGQLTRSAVQKLQEKYGIIPALGYFGQLTRQKIQDLQFWR
ncbi:MAG: hypothetical protein A2749_02025 [Parcubacteria group bacterium RIFCSPHIGHO2_01_FULL_45_26]|nr:MAG: hypothetical protein A2749_02025 [Parcubacteria group bacterium RIFCSPHIGHO2_01_FULL_45_26]